MGDFIYSLSTIVVIFGAVFLYFLPTIITHKTRPDFVPMAAILNIALGCTCIGWLVLLAISLWPNKGEAD